jgi:hypothetical protein
MNTINKSQILEAEKLATLYAGDLRAKGYTPSNCVGVTPDKVLRVQFQNGELNEISVPIGKVAAWVKLVPQDLIRVEFHKLPQGCRKVILVAGGSMISFLDQTANTADFQRVTAVPPIRFDDKHTGEFQLEKPAGLENLSANIKAAKAAKEFAKLRGVEIKAKADLKSVSGEHCRNLEILAGGIAPAIAQARLIVKCRRMLRRALMNVQNCPAWFNETEIADFDFAKNRLALSVMARDAYKPKMVMPRWGNKPEDKRPVYGPKFTALETAVKQNLAALKDLILSNFRQQVKLNGLPDFVGYEKLHLGCHCATMRPYSRARIAVRGYADKKAPFAIAYADALKARRKAQPKLAALGGVIIASATKADGSKIAAMPLAATAESMANQIEQANQAGAIIHIHESANPLYPMGDILPKVETSEPVNETHRDLQACVAAIEPAPVAAPVDSNIGRKWNSPYGPQIIIRRDNMPAGDLYDVQTVGTATIRRYDVARIEETIATDEHRTTPEYAAELAGREEMARLRAESAVRQAAKQAAIESEIAEFTAGLSPLLAGKYQAALLKQASYNGEISTRKTFIEKQVAAGAVVELATEPGNTCRYLKTVAGGYFTEDQTTKAGIEYALYLIAQKPVAPAPVAPAPVSPRPLPVGNFRALCRNLALATVKPIAPELPEPEKPFAISCDAETLQPAKIMVRIIRRDAEGKIINGNFPMTEASGPVVLPPIPPRAGSALATMIEAGQRLANMMRGETLNPI